MAQILRRRSARALAQTQVLPPRQALACLVQVPLVKAACLARLRRSRTRNKVVACLGQSLRRQVVFSVHKQVSRRRLVVFSDRKQTNHNKAVVFSARRRVSRNKVVVFLDRKLVSLSRVVVFSARRPVSRSRVAVFSAHSPAGPSKAAVAFLVHSLIRPSKVVAFLVHKRSPSRIVCSDNPHHRLIRRHPCLRMQLRIPPRKIGS